MASTPTSGDLSSHAATLAAITAHPAFLEMLSEIEAQPEGQRMAKAEQLASVSELQRRGVPVPPGLRLTTRYFENPGQAQRTEQLLHLNEMVGTGAASQPPGGPMQTGLRTVTVCASGGFFFCVSVGAEI
jgi:hypothetical protein